MSDAKPVVYIGMPRHGPLLHAGAAKALYVNASKRYASFHGEHESSLIPLNCNALWAQALTLRRSDGVTHFAMIHSDVCPEPYWVDTLMDEAEKVGADMISAVVPFRGTRGLTSTGIANPKVVHCSRRLTLKEVFERDETWTEPNLLLNTGLCLVKLGDWAERVSWRQQDWIVLLENGAFKAVSHSEDWDFTRQVRAWGGKVYATRKVKLYHGERHWNNCAVWGEWDTDTDYEATVAAHEASKNVIEGPGNPAFKREAVTA